jgi:hypothetical protein
VQWIDAALQQPERVVGCFGSSRRQYPVSRNLSRNIAKEFQVENRSLKWRAPKKPRPAAAPTLSVHISGAPHPVRFMAISCCHFSRGCR